MAQNVIQGPEQTNRSEIRFGAVLGGRQYDLKLTWLPCQSFWELEMIGSAGQSLLVGVKVTANVDMLQPYSDSRMPPGQLVCHDTTNKQEDPGRNDWRERHRLVYVDPEPEADPVEIHVTRIYFPS